MNLKRITAIFMACFLLASNPAKASVLGSERIEHSRVEIGPGAVLETNAILSDQSGVGLQTEHYVEYTPNKVLLPAIINNRYLCDRSSITGMGNSLMAQGTHTSMIMNADYFSMAMGYPVSHQVIDGNIVVKDYGATDSLGINSDGTAFIAPLTINLTAEIKDSSIQLNAVNKERQNWGIFVFTDKFAPTTKAVGKGTNIVVDLPGGEIPAEGVITGKVEEVYEAEGEVYIPEGKIIITAHSDAADYIINFFSLFEVGDEVKLSVTMEGHPGWTEASYILGAVGGRLLTDSEITITDAAASPRSAVGIKDDGTVIFYTIDGRQSGYSYGVRLKTLATRMKELGCTDAINLDGGGSTAMGAVLPGYDKVSLINSPSEKSERYVPNYLALINTGEKSDKAARLFMYPYSGNYLSGTLVSFTAYATDNNFHKTALPGDITFTGPDGKTSKDGRITLTGDGEVTVTASGDEAEGSVKLNCVENPTDIVLRNKSTNTVVEKIDLPAEGTISLKPEAYSGSKYLTADAGCFTWSCSGDIGTIDRNGNFAAANKTASGEITVSAGKYTKRIPVKVTRESEYTKITFAEASPGHIVISFDEEIGEDSIVLKVDGERSGFELFDGKIQLDLEDGKMHKINVQAINSNGYKTVAYHTSGGEGYPNSFADIPENYWALDYIAYMNHRKVIQGTLLDGKYHFNPAKNVTRGEFAVMVANMLRIDTESFEDTSLDMDDEDSIASWCINHIKALCELGIMNGKKVDGKLIFDYRASLTRGEAMTVISGLLPDKITEDKPVFEDSDLIPSWSGDAFDKLAGMGILQGYTDGTIRPLNNITRAEVIRLLYEIY